MCRICRARGLGRGARDGGAPPGVAFVDAWRPPEDDEIPCGFATADARSDAETSVSGADGDGPPPPPVTRVVVGAGVAGTCCAEELCRLRPRDAVVLVTAGDAVKSVRQVERVTKNVETVHIEEKPATALSHANLSVVSNAAAVGLLVDGRVVDARLDGELVDGRDGRAARGVRRRAVGRLTASPSTSHSHSDSHPHPHSDSDSDSDSHPHSDSRSHSHSHSRSRSRSHSHSHMAAGRGPPRRRRVRPRDSNPRPSHCAR